MDDGGWIIRHARDDGDVRVGQVQNNRVVVFHHDGAFDGFVGVCIHQRCHATGHRVAFNALVAPHFNVARHVGGGEVVAIVPLHAFTDVQGVLGGIVIGRPAFQQHRLERPVRVVFHQVFQPTCCNRCDLCPVKGAWILQRFDVHLHAHCAALLGVGGRFGRCVQPDQTVSRSGGQPQSCGARHKFAAVHVPVFVLGRVHFCGRMHEILVVRHLVLPVTQCGF